jgi:hypothetical protein
MDTSTLLPTLFLITALVTLGVLGYRYSVIRKKVDEQD